MPKSKKTKKPLTNFHLTQHKFIFPKNLPEEWEKLYVIQFKRFKKKYSGEKYISDPTTAVLVERLAYLNARLEYIESPDYHKKEIEVLEDKFEFERLHDRIQTNLLKAIGQIERFAKRVFVKEPEEKKHEQEVLTVSDLTKLSDEEISDRINRATEVKITPRGAEKT